MNEDAEVSILVIYLIFTEYDEKALKTLFTLYLTHLLNLAVNIPCSVFKLMILSFLFGRITFQLLLTN
jgi:hypothetical protein